ncbi:hypothetical protein ABFS83_11G016300 [Erythranthe nasuta]
MASGRGTQLCSSQEHNNQNPRFMEAVSNFLSQHQQTAVRSSSISGNSWNSFLIYSGDMPARMPAGDGGLVEFLNETLGFRRENGGDYFIGPGVEEFFRHVTLNNRRGPPPASRSMIDDLSTVKISRKHVRAESTCAVCKERFESGTRVKKLPCGHLYHSECIGPWLEQRSSCPVCRQKVTCQQKVNGSIKRRLWSSLWPFGSSSRANGNRGERIEPSSLSYR